MEHLFILTILLTIIWHKAIKYLYLLTDTRAVRYDDIYRMDEIKSLSFHIMFYRLFRGCRKIHCLRYFFIIWMTAIFTRHHGAWRGDITRWRTTRTKRGTTSVAWARVFKHCSFKTTNFKLLKRKQQSYVCAVSVSVWEDRTFFSALLALNDYITHLCVRIPVFASILINTAI